MMRSDLFNARWQQIRNHAKQWWGELTDDDLDEIQGRRAVLVGKSRTATGAPEEAKWTSTASLRAESFKLQ